MKKFLYPLSALLSLLAPGVRAQLSVGSTATLYVGSGATLTVNGNAQNAGTFTNQGHLYLRGDLQNTATLTSDNGDLTLDGSTAQTLTSSSALSVRDLTVNNSSAGDAVTLASPLTVGGVATFTDGVLKTDATNLLIFADGSSVGGASDASHANGPVRKLGSDAFVFPLGSGVAYRPASIAPQSGVATDAFTAQYQPTDPGNTASKAACLESVSPTGHWQVDRTAGNASAVVGLAYADALPSGTNPANLRVARYADPAWEALTCAANSGLTDGQVLTDGAIAQFGTFAVALRTVVLTATYPGLGPVCAGREVTVQATVEGEFNEGNTLTAQLSNAAGDFTTPAATWTVGLGTSVLTLPENLPTGNGYRLRVVSTDPARTSAPSNAFTVTAIGGSGAVASLTTPASACAGEALAVSFTTAGGCPAPGTFYAVQLSSATGSFANPRVLGQSRPGTTLLALPTDLPPGSGYRVRLVNGGQTSASSAPFRVEGPSLSGVTPAVGGAPVCRGQAVTVSFQLPAGSCAFPEGNVFTAQLSSGFGNFSNPTSLGPVQAGVPNPVTIPASVATGSSYRIRVVSSLPASTSLTSISFRVNACTSRLSADPEYSGEVVVAPNPVSGGEIRVRVRGLDNPAFSLTTSTGRSVGYSEKTDGSGEFVLTPKQALAPGLYVLQASEGTTRITRRVLVVE